jgi:hypothetical protein
MLLQEQIEREAEAALGQSSRAVMAGHAAIRKQSCARFAFIEILRSRRHQDQQRSDAKGEQDASAPNRSHHVVQDPLVPTTSLRYRGQACQKEGAIYNSGGSNQLVNANPPSTVIAAPVT